MAYTFFVILIVLLSILMVFIVLIQESKGGGLSSEFSSANAIMGVRKTTNGVEKLTWGLAAAMVVISVICAYVSPKATADQSVLEHSATETQTLPIRKVLEQLNSLLPPQVHKRAEPLGPQAHSHRHQLRRKRQLTD